MSKYGKFNYFSGDRHAVWPGEDSEGEVFVRLELPSFSISLSPREALALAEQLGSVADFIVNGSDTLGA